MTPPAYSDHPLAPRRRSIVMAATWALIALSAILFPTSPTQASGLYVSGGAGANFATDADVTGTGINTSIDFDPGPIAIIAAGYDFETGFRGELELAGRWNDAETVGGAAGSGDTTVISSMVNVMYDVGIDSTITPYLGAGLGAARIDDSGISPISGSSISDDDTVFAYQAIAGASYTLNNSWSLTADYRYFATGDVSLATASNVAVDQEYSSHSVLVGLRLNLGGSSTPMPEPSADMAPAPPPVPSSIPAAETPMEPDAAAMTAASDMTQIATASAIPAYPRAYRLLFDWDKKALNPLALDTIAAIAMNAKEGEIIRIRATGHADRSGTEAYNDSLSRARAEAVQKALIKLGIPADQIVVDWRGERDPVVDTADGVRELQNRRVEIVFQAN